MDPSSFMSSFTGILAVAMSLGIPVLAIIATMAIIMAVIRTRNRERMKMIEQGILPPPAKKKTGNYYTLLVWGAILLAFGLAMSVAELVVHDGTIIAGLIFSFIGLAMLVCFIIIRTLRKKDQAAPEPTEDEEPPANPA
jgi:preprotein translocase subunit YajC